MRSSKTTCAALIKRCAIEKFAIKKPKGVRKKVAVKMVDLGLKW